MKALKIIIIIAFFLCNGLLFSQSSDCGSALPFCAGAIGTTFPASPDGSGDAEAGPDYGCLISQPSPAWYFFQVGTGGNIDIRISGTGGGDVDFICWGPFTQPSGNCNNLTSGNEVDCSFSARATETCNIQGAVAGQYYMLLITNYSGDVQDINFNQIGGNGSTECALLSGVTSSTICPAQTATLTANTNLNNPIYSWSNGIAGTPSIVVNPAITTVYTVTINGTNAAGTPSVISSTGTVTVRPSPTVAITNDSKVCPGFPMNFTATSGLSSYTWSGPPNFNRITYTGALTIPDASDSKMGIYSVLAKSVHGCTATASTTIGLVVTESITVVPSYTICEGGTLNLAANANTANSYTWSGPSAYSSSNPNSTINSVNLSQAGSYTVTASFTSANTTCYTKNTSSVFIIPAAPIPLNQLTSVCNNGDINLLGPGGANVYEWSGPNNFSSPLQNPVINNTSTINKGIYSLKITTNGCVNTGTVNVNVYDPLSFLIPPNDATVCEGKTTLLTSKGNGGSGVYKYQWLPTTDLSSPISAITTGTGNTTTNYTLTLFDANCAITPSIAALVTLSVNPTPIITFNTSNARGCEPFYTDLISSSNPVSANCSWRFSKNLSTNSCNVNPFTFPLHGTYDATLTVTDINGCIDSVSQNAFVVVDPKPMPNFDWLPDNPTILNNAVNFYDASTVGLPIRNWKWDFGDNNVISPTENSSTVNNPSHVYELDGNYLVSLEVTNSFGCIDNISKYVIVEDEFVLYIPNAFSPIKDEGLNDLFTVKGMGLKENDFEMRIYSRGGELVFKTTDFHQGWNGTIKGGTEIKEGVYVYKIEVRDYKNKLRQFVGHVTVL